MSRLWNGNVVLREGWALAAETVEFDGKQWAVMYHQKVPGYADVKVSVCGKAKNKANYWMAWIVKDGRMVRGRESKIMLDNRPELFEGVSEVLRKVFAPK